jgi:flavin reductase (DIM6/NTAB) family NADH-FMN oxidoreductase RutF
MGLSAANNLFNLTDREVWIVTAAHGDRRGGLVATFVCRASLVDSLPRVLMALSKQHHTHQLIEGSGGFGLHLISARQMDWVWNFGMQTGHNEDKLKGWDVEMAVTGTPLLSEAIGWLDCRVESRMNIGDRTVYIAEVVAAHQNRDEPPLTMQELLKLAPRERLDELERLRKRDIAIDAQAIVAWRGRQSEGSSSA